MQKEALLSTLGVAMLSASAFAAPAVAQTTDSTQVMDSPEVADSAQIAESVETADSTQAIAATATSDDSLQSLDEVIGSGSSLFGSSEPEAPAVEPGEQVGNIYQVNSGSANVYGGNTTTANIGDTVPVSWTVQGYPLVRSSNSGETVNSMFIYVPDVVKNLSITSTNGPVDYTAEPIAQESIANGQVPDTKFNEQLFYNTEYDATVTGDENSKLGGWTRYTVPLAFDQVSTFTVSGEVTIQTKDTYVPIRALSKTWRCSGEGGGAGSFEQGCQIIKTGMPYNPADGDPENWAPALEGPIFSLNDPETIHAQAEQYAQHGNEGFTTPGCHATGGGVNPTAIGEDFDPSFSTGEAYADDFNLANNTDINYNVPWAMEDGFDQAHYWITVPDPEEPGSSLTGSVTEGSLEGSLTEGSADGSDAGSVAGSAALGSLGSSSLGSVAPILGGAAVVGSLVAGSVALSSDPAGSSVPGSSEPAPSPAPAPAPESPAPSPAQPGDHPADHAGPDAKAAAGGEAVPAPATPATSPAAEAPSRGMTLANTGINGNIAAMILAVGLLAVAGGALMIRRNRA